MQTLKIQAAVGTTKEGMHITIANDRIKFLHQNTTKIYSNVALEKEGM